MRYLMALAVILGLSLPTIAADEKPKPSPEDQFKKMDKNGDGKISLEEFKGKRQGDKATKAEAAFKRRDKDNDGFLSLEEFKATGKKKGKK